MIKIATTLAICIAALLASVVNMYDYFNLMRFTEVVAALDRGASASRDQLEQARNETRRLSKALPKCSERQGRGDLTIAIASARALTSQDSQQYSSSIRENLSLAANERLRCNPLDGNAWLLKAMYLYESKPDPAAALRAFFLSCDISPNERWIIDRRLSFLSLVSRLSDLNLTSCMKRDLTKLIKFYQPGAIADFYLSSNNEIRSQIKILWVDLELSSRIAIARSIDGVGLVLDRQFWLEQVMKGK